MKFPDSEALAVAFLEARVTPHVGTKVPKQRPAAFVRVWRTGGSAVNRVLDQPTLTIQAWGPNSYELIRVCREAFLNEYTSMPLVRGVAEITGPYYDPDPGSNTDRYSCNMQLQVRAQR